MGMELIIVGELANISVTITELSSIANIINKEISNKDFNFLFNKIIGELGSIFDVVIDNLQPLSELLSEESFTADFDRYHATYTACYLHEGSKPRIYTEATYEPYLELKRMKESKTSFPLLKRTFKRLDDLNEKWVTNDAWLVMYIDNLFKRLHRLLNEIAELKQKDISDAYLIYHCAFTDFNPYLALIKQRRELLRVPG